MPQMFFLSPASRVYNLAQNSKVFSNKDDEKTIVLYIESSDYDFVTGVTQGNSLNGITLQNVSCDQFCRSLTSVDLVEYNILTDSLTIQLFRFKSGLRSIRESDRNIHRFLQCSLEEYDGKHICNGAKHLQCKKWAPKTALFVYLQFAHSFLTVLNPHPR